MCGIVGYIGHRKAYDVLVQGLHRLEYRGYDSAGVAVMKDDGQLNVHKSKGKVVDLEAKVAGYDLDGNIGIAHTRWATHGEPNDVNAHPQVSQNGRIALVHNGTIENDAVLKEALARHGYTFSSDTDTEVLVQLIEYIQAINSCRLFDAVKEALKQVEGAYAIAVLEEGNPDTLVAARKGVSIRPTTDIEPLYTTIATVTMKLIVAASFCFVNALSGCCSFHLCGSSSSSSS